MATVSSLGGSGEAELLVNGSASGSANISIGSGSVLDVTGEFSKNAAGTAVAALSPTTPVANPHFVSGTDGSGGTLLRIQNPNTFSGSYPSGIVLSTPSTQNPATITASAFVGTGTIASDPRYGVLGTAGFAWTVTNYGHIEGETDGVYLTAGGTLTNGASGAGAAFIEGGYGDGVLITGAAGTVVNYGTIEATGSGTHFGVYLKHGGNVANAGLIEGAELGIQIAGAAGTVGNSGTIDATGGGISQGIDLEAGGSIANGAANALIEGGYGIRVAGATGTVDNFGTIAGRSASGVILETGGSVRNEAGALIEATAGGRDGVFIYTAPGTVANYGTIEGYRIGAHLQTGGAVINAASAIIEGNLGGVGFGSAGGSIVNSGTIEGTGTSAAGVYMKAGGTFTNQAGGIVQGGSQGFYGHGVVAIVNDGTIEATDSAGIGVQTGNGSLSNAGLIEGATGVDITASYESLTNRGTIGGTVTYGAAFYGGASLSNAAGGVIYGVRAGIEINGTGGSIGIIDNLGTIDATSTFGSGVVMLSGGTVTNGASGSGTAMIAGGRFGIELGGGASGTVINFATIEATGSGGVGVELFSTGDTLINGPSGAASALISGYSTGAYLSHPASVLVNYGTIEGTGTQSLGVDLYGGQLTNAPGGLIEGSVGGVGGGRRYATVLNEGTIRGTGSLSSYGVDILRNGSVTNTASAVISGATAGVAIDGGATLGSVVNFGTIEATATQGTGVKLASYGTGSGTLGNDATAALIEGGRFGVFIYATPGATATISNIGTIEATQGFGVGVYVRDAALTMVNGTSSSAAAVIEGGHYGVKAAFGANATIANYGTIDGTSGVGIFLASGGSVGNVGSAALIEGAAFGISAPSSSATISNSGTIEATAANGVGIDLIAGGTIVDSGTIIGMTAIYMGGTGNNLLTLDAGSLLSGSIVAGGTANALELASASGTGTLSGFGTGILGFDTITVDTGAKWLLSGTNSLGGAASLSNAGTLADSGTLALGGSLVNSGILDIENGARLDLYTGGSGSGIIAFYGTGDILQIGSTGAPAALSDAITNFAAGDTIDMGGIVANGTIYAGGVLTLTDNGTVVAGLTLSTNVGGPGFVLTSDGNGGTDIALVSQPGTVIGTNQYYGIVLSVPSTQNPATIDPGVYVTNRNGGDAVLGETGFAWTVTNLGTIDITGTNGADGVYLADGGYIRNGASNDGGAQIEANVNAIEVHSAAGTVVNYGTLLSTGTSGEGVILLAGGTVANKTGGLVSGSSDGVYIAGPGTVVNYGTITGTGTYGDGVSLTGGIVANGAGGLIAGDNIAVAIGLGNAGGPGTVVNDGSIAGTGSRAIGVLLIDGGSVTNKTGGVISGYSDGVHVDGAAGTVVNYGSIVASGADSGDAVYLGNGGSVLNKAGGFIGGYSGAIVSGAPGTLVNYGTIHGSLQHGAYFAAGGTVTNGTGGTIAGPTDGVGFGSDTVGYVENAGTILAIGTTAGAAVSLGGGGFVDNAQGAVIAGAVGVAAKGAATLVNHGTIVSGYLPPAYFGAGVYLSAGGTVDNFGTIEGFGSDNGGVLVGIYAAGAKITNEQTGLIYGDHGIGVNAGSATIANYGTVVALSNDGVFLEQGGSVVNAAGGTIAGYGAGVAFDGAVGYLANSGTILATADGSSGLGFTAGGTIANNAGGTIIGVGYGVLGSDGGTVVNHGLISGYYYGIDLSGAAASVANYGTVQNLSGGSGPAIRLADGGTIDNQGLISGPTGIYLDTAGVVINGTSGSSAGTISGGTGIVMNGTGGGSVVNYGTISATVGASGYATGVVLAAGNSMTNFGIVTAAGAKGIGVSLGGGYLRNGATVGSAALISGGHYAVYLGGGGTAVNYGTISGGVDAVISRATIVAIDNFGTIAGISANSGGVYLFEGSVTNEAGGVITGDGVGVDIARYAGTIDNLGTIASTNRTAGSGVFLGAGGIVTNASGGAIGGYQFGVEIAGSPGSVVNLGTIDAGGQTFENYGLRLLDGGAVTNGTSGATNALIIGVGGIGAYISGLTAATTVINFGSIVGTGGTAGIGVGIELGYGAVTNAAGGLIAGTFEGIEIVDEGATVANLGTIKGTGTDSAGVFFDDYGSVGNGAAGNTAALITGTLEGIEIDNLAGTALAGATIANFGTIEGASGTGFGIFIGNGLVVNGASNSAAALISGGFGIESYGTPASTVINFGTIAGSGDGVFIDGSDSTLVNAGTIVGQGGTAVMFAGGGNRLVVDPGAVFTGVVNGGTGGDTIELASANGTGTLAGLGSDFIGFASVVVDSGAVWDVTGTPATPPAFTNDGTVVVSTGTLDLGAVGEDAGDTGVIDVGHGGLAVFDGSVAAGQTIDFTGASAQIELADAGGFSGSVTNFQSGDTIDLENVTATGTIYANGILTLTDNGNIVAELAISTNEASPVFLLGTDGNGGTDVTLQQPRDNVFSGYFPNGIVLDDAATQNPATITASGTVTNKSGNIAILGTGGYDWTVTNYGTIEGAAFGVELMSGGVLINSADPGYIEGTGTGVEITGGAGTVVNGGTIVSKNGAGVLLHNGGIVTNGVGALISAYANGVAIENAAGMVENLGTIEESTTGLASDVYLQHGGTVINGSPDDTTALLLSQNRAIQIGYKGGLGTVINYGTIITTSATATRMTVQLVSGGTVENYGTIANYGNNAIVLNAAGSVGNAANGLVSGATGIYIGGGQGTVANLGTIEGNGVFYHSGVYLHAGGVVVNGTSGSSAALIAGDWIGVGIAGGGTVVNYGTIDALGTQAGTHGLFGLGVFMPNGGYVLNRGLIEATGFTALYIGGSGGVATVGAVGTVVNYGTVASGARNGIAFAAGGTIVNHGLVESNSRTGVYIGGTLGTVTNLGTVESGGAYYHSGIYLDKGGIVVNGTGDSSAGLVEAEWIGVGIAGGGTVVNYGTIDSLGTQAGTAGNIGLAVFLPNGGYLLNYGLIEAAGFAAVSMGGQGGIPQPGGVGIVINYGTIESAQSSGIALAEGGTIVNGGAEDPSALIEGGTNSVAIYIGGLHGTLVSGASGTVVNYGTIENMTTLHSAVVLGEGGVVANAATGIILGGLNGVSTVATGGSGGAGTILNNGTIAGLAGNGVYLGAGGQIVNSGTISGATNGILLTGGKDASVLNFGLVEGGVGILISAADKAANTIVDGGTVVGTSGTAVYFAGGKDTLAIDDKAVFVGNVIGDGGTLELMTGTSAGTVSLGGTITGFDRVKVDAGAVWQFSDAASGPPALTNDGTLDIAGQAAFGNVRQDKKSKGTIRLAAGAAAEFGGSVSAHQKFVFTAGSGLLRLDDASAFKGRIVGFRSGDLIDIVESGANGFSFTASFANHTLTVSYFGTTIASLKLTGKFQTSDFTLSADGRGGVYVSLGAPSPGARSRAALFSAAGAGAAGGGKPAAAFEPFGGTAQSLFAASPPAADNSLVNSLADPFHFWTLPN